MSDHRCLSSSNLCPAFAVKSRDGACQFLYTSILTQDRIQSRPRARLCHSSVIMSSCNSYGKIEELFPVLLTDNDNKLFHVRGFHVGINHNLNLN
jgi:hypothetical protein